MGCFSLLFYALILKMTAMQIAGQEIGWFTQTPLDAALLEGDSVVLKCQLDIRRIVEHGEYKVTWSKNEKKLNFTDPEHSHYWLTGDPHSAQYYLLISQADLADSGVFSCAVFENIGTDAGADLWIMHAVTTAMVQVVVRPSPPECRKTDLDVPANRTRPDINYEGDLIELACTGYLSHPSFTLTMTWKGQVITAGDGAWIHIDEDQVQEQAYRVTADYQDNGASFQCTLTSTELDYNETCEMVALNILHEPKLFFVSDRSEVHQGESLTVSCLSVSNPSQVFFSWHTEPAQTVSYRSGRQVLQIPSVLSDTGFLNITCVVTNDHGVSILSTLVPVLPNTTEPVPTQPEVPIPPEPIVHTTPEESTQAPPTNPSTSAPTTQPGVEPVTKPDKTTTKTPTKETTPSKDNQGLYNHHSTMSTPVIAVLAILPVIIIAILILIFVFLYKTVKLSTKRRDDEIRVVYRDGASTVIDRRTHGIRGNLNVTVEPAAVNEGAVVPTDGMEPGAYSMPPPYTKGELPSVLDTTSVAAGGQDALYFDEIEKGDSHTYVDVKL
ncbi:uncharacterized protein LOC119746234 [Patiria miniata]|uniref:Ig-like domain-containing protein n=1 Tax=Patiria miniata TaxID=46514 RepID=A0A914BSN8_PATMI|nr:uncharacterized protein LOC119746234 [Patiria miniata]